MVERKAFTFVSLAAGSLGGILGLKAAGGKPRFVCDPRATCLKNIEQNFPDVPCQRVDARWFANRKEKGAADLLHRAKLKVGELNILEASVLHGKREAASKELPNFYDIFSITKRVRPEILLALGPAELSTNKNLPHFENQLEHIRFLRPKEAVLQRAYYVGHRVLNSADYGVSVAKSYTVIVGIRKDIAQKCSIAADLAILSLFPSPANFEPRPLREALANIRNKLGEEEFWEKEILSNTLLLKASRFLKKEPATTTYLSAAGEHQLRKLGYKKNGATHVFRCSFDSALPDISDYDPRDLDNWGLVHPSRNRCLTSSEISAAVGLPANLTLAGNELEKAIISAQSIPPALVKAVTENVLLSLNNPSKTKLAGNDINDIALKIQLVENLKAKDETVRVYNCDTDLGDSFARELQGATPGGKHFDYIFDADEIGQDFVVLGPVDPTSGRRPVIGGIKRGVYSQDDRRRLVSAINHIRGVSEYRGSCSPEPIRSEIIKDLEAKQRKYELSLDKRSYRVWINPKKDEKEGHWDRWRTNPIPSATEGWSLDKNTRMPQLSKTFTNNPKLKEDFDYLNEKANYAYLKIAPVEFKKQLKFIKGRMNPKYTLGKTVFTSLAINKYGDEMPAMNFHIDSGDNNSGLTSITVFNNGNYNGGYFVLPQYKVAFKVGDSDVFVGNSRKVHGVTKIEGNGQRLSVVSYANTALGYDEYTAHAYPPKSPRPNFKWTSYKIAIPSYKRPETLKKKTLMLLSRHNIDPKRVTVFVANESERKIYEKALKDSQYKKLIVGEHGIKNIRNFMWNFYPENTPVIFIDDDISDLLMFPAGSPFSQDEEKHTLVPVRDLERDLISAGFNMMRENSAYIWGIYAVINDYFMKNRVAVGLYFIVGSFFGAIIRHCKDLECNTDEKEDYERSIQHFIKDGRVVRLDFATAETAYYKEPGGLNSARRNSAVSEGAEYLLKRYPKYCEDAGIRDKGQNKGMREIRLKEDFG